MIRFSSFFRLLLLNKLLEDGNSLFRKDKLTEAVFRYEYALKKLPQMDKESSNQDDADGPDSKRLDEIFVKLRSHLLLNLSRAQRRLGNYPAASARATQALELAQARRGGGRVVAQPPLRPGQVQEEVRP